ncbi:hypothetical protein [Streptomyces sp. GC420]|uniref:hypothetical protein n=1 Tax=Streptomyces sp. GC420 TaxID=2697568 RepID=UPI001414F339|nr:hypothetical protein [Streptomyces sp. GC420]NBM19210.1 hypothetical protein [Streptomyces sp. GC420]
MTGRKNEPLATATAVRLRIDGEVDEQTVAYARRKVDAVVTRPGLPAVTGEVRLAKAAAHHVAQPWTAAAELSAGGRTVVVNAQAATGSEVVDELQDRMRRQLEKAAHAHPDRRNAPAPPWRGGTATDTPVA